MAVSIWDGARSVALSFIALNGPVREGAIREESGRHAEWRRAVTCRSFAAVLID
jgi:hypothetical protein